ncbi:GMC family oxidoreductase [Vulgatibacter incomptus]|uniref:Oxidoreductase, GMC family n=1 Tax=Vulgatibacter incomptus TaxID=1391653 RepID=A0A0K1PJJ0_9BACT|nr:GMC family oxidoreductase [Vulgatibacter incomptus]AKU93259.1 Oxidoreductase, GMC family [Vulgatibacter incomptus]
MKGEIVHAGELRKDADVSCDVCIVGSGAGGATLAAGLVERGMRVVMLEEGGHHTKSEFDLQEGTAYPMLYQERGMRATADLAITILQGRAVGGSTTINWTTCFRTPDSILDHWREHHGVDGIDLGPHFDAVEERLSIHEWPIERANANNRVLWDGCRKLGWEARPLRRNVRGCASTGFCGMGCPLDAKQSMLVTYVPDALERGLSLYVNTRAERLEVEKGQVTAIHCVALDPGTDQPTGRRIVIRPKVAVSSGGAINGPALLLRSGLNRNGRVGKRTFLHPVVAMAAFFDEKVNAFYGAPQSVGSHHFADRGPGKIGFFLETPPVHPMLAATAFCGFGSEHRDFLSRLAHVGVLIALSVDGILPGDEGGTVSLRRDGRVRVDYPVGERLEESFRASCLAMARIQLAAGAREVRSLHLEPVTLRSEADLPLLERAPWGALRHSIFTAHQMGGCAMGADPATSVVDSTLRHHEIHNLFVVDGSVFPTSLGVNPSETIYALAHWALDRVASAV